MSEIKRYCNNCSVPIYYPTGSYSGPPLPHSWPQEMKKIKVRLGRAYEDIGDEGEKTWAVSIYKCPQCNEIKFYEIDENTIEEKKEEVSICQK